MLSHSGLLEARERLQGLWDQVNALRHRDEVDTYEVVKLTLRYVAAREEVYRWDLLTMYSEYETARVDLLAQMVIYGEGSTQLMQANQRSQSAYDALTATINHIVGLKSPVAIPIVRGADQKDREEKLIFNEFAGTLKAADTDQEDDDIKRFAAAFQQALQAGTAEDDARRRATDNISELGLSGRAFNPLRKEGLTSIRGLADMGWEGLLDIKYIGQKSGHEIRYALVKYGHIREDDPVWEIK